MLVRSSECSVEWLCEQLQKRWFGGEDAVNYDPTKGDVVLVRVGTDGAVEPWGDN